MFFTEVSREIKSIFKKCLSCYHAILKFFFLKLQWIDIICAQFWQYPLLSKLLKMGLLIS